MEKIKLNKCKSCGSDDVTVDVQILKNGTTLATCRCYQCKVTADTMLGEDIDQVVSRASARWNECNLEPEEPEKPNPDGMELAAMQKRISQLEEENMMLWMYIDGEQKGGQDEKI